MFIDIDKKKIKLQNTGKKRDKFEKKNEDDEVTQSKKKIEQRGRAEAWRGFVKSNKYSRFYVGFVFHSCCWIIIFRKPHENRKIRYKELKKNMLRNFWQW